MKLGYEYQAYYKFTDLMNKFFDIFGPHLATLLITIHGYSDVMVIVNKF